MNIENNQLPNKNSEVNRILKSNIYFAVISLLLLIVFEFIFPAIKIPLRLYNRIYSLLNFSTAHLDLSKLLTYVLFLICGFAFVNLVNLKNKRNNPFIGPNGYSDTKKVVLFGFIIFFLSGNFLLLGKYDFEGFCKGKAKIKNTSDNELSYFNKLYVYFPDKSNDLMKNAGKEINLPLNEQYNHKENYNLDKDDMDSNEEFDDNKMHFNHKRIVNNRHIADNKSYNEKFVKDEESENDNIYFSKDNLTNKRFESNNDINARKSKITKNSNMVLKRKDIGFFKKLTYNISLGLYAFTKNLSEYLNPEFYFKLYKTECKYPVFFERVFQNYFFFILPFIIGLNFTYLDYIPELQKFTLAWHDMKNWGLDLWALFVALCLFILFTISFLFYSIIQTSLIRFAIYALFLASLIVYVFMKTKKEEKKGKHFHLHHYALMLVLNWFLGIHHDYFMILLGVFSGIMIEGSCRWGISSCWSDDN